MHLTQGIRYVLLHSSKNEMTEARNIRPNKLNTTYKSEAAMDRAMYRGTASLSDLPQLNSIRNSSHLLHNWKTPLLQSVFNLLGTSSSCHLCSPPVKLILYDMVKGYVGGVQLARKFQTVLAHRSAEEFPVGFKARGGRYECRVWH